MLVSRTSECPKRISPAEGRHPFRSPVLFNVRPELSVHIISHHPVEFFT